MVFTYAHILAGMVLSASLPNDDIAGNGFLAAIYFNAQPFAFRFAPVLYFTLDRKSVV